VQKIIGLIKSSVPSFMDKRNADSLAENAEFWLGAKGTGARAHMDSHCISTLSVVMHGKRRWRIGPPPRMPPQGGKSDPEEVVFDDGVAYKLKWKPMYEFTVKAGEGTTHALPRWIHLLPRPHSLFLSGFCVCRASFPSWVAPRDLQHR